MDTILLGFMKYMLLNSSEKTKVYNIKNGTPQSKRTQLAVSIVDPFVYKYNHGYWFRRENSKSDKCNELFRKARELLESASKGQVAQLITES